MHVLFLTHYFPPEVNAPATRTYENAKRWVKAGHKVTIITCAPNHPNGIIYPGYENRIRQWDEIDGIRVLRVKTYLSANKGFLKRIFNYVSYMFSATLLCSLVKNVDVVVSTSPQFFSGLSGFFVSRLKSCSWVLEIRDLWPESVIAVGAIKNRRVINLLEGIESLMYRKADHIVSVTQSFKKHIENREIYPGKITIITNGADFDSFTPLPKKNGISDKLGLNDKFVVSYIGTHGMAHALDTALRAAELLSDREDIVFLLVGDGAERDNLLKQKEALGLNNVIMVGQQEKSKIPQFLGASDACMILLRKTDLFKTVIPSKMFETMAMERPIILGVEGESKAIIERGECGLCIEPENETQLADAVLKLYENEKFSKRLGLNGKRFAMDNYDREKLAERYLDLLEEYSCTD